MGEPGDARCPSLVCPIITHSAFAVGGAVGCAAAYACVSLTCADLDGDSFLVRRNEQPVYDTNQSMFLGWFVEVVSRPGPVQVMGQMSFLCHR